MKNTIYFIGTCFISTFAMFGALGAKNPFPLFAVAFGIWALFIWGANRRAKKNSVRRGHEQMFNEFMRSKQRQTGRR